MHTHMEVCSNKDENPEILQHFLNQRFNSSSIIPKLFPNSIASFWLIKNPLQPFNLFRHGIYDDDRNNITIAL